MGSCTTMFENGMKGFPLLSKGIKITNGDLNQRRECEVEYIKSLVLFLVEGIGHILGIVHILWRKGGLEQLVCRKMLRLMVCAPQPCRYVLPLPCVPIIPSTSFSLSTWSS